MPLRMSSSARRTCRPSSTSVAVLRGAAAAGKRAHIVQQASFFGSVSFSPAFPAPRACVGQAGSLLLCETPLLATASAPLPCARSLQTSQPLLGRQPTLRSSPASSGRKQWGGDPTNERWKLSWAICGPHFVACIERKMLWCCSFVRLQQAGLCKSSNT